MFIDTGSIAEQVKEVCPGGVDKVLELVGTTTLKDSLRCAKQRGIVCMTGIVGNKWSFDNFSPMEAIPTAVSLTTMPANRKISCGCRFKNWSTRSRRAHCTSRVGKTFHLEDIVEAHRMHGGKQSGWKDRGTDLADESRSGEASFATSEES